MEYELYLGINILGFTCLLLISLFHIFGKFTFESNFKMSRKNLSLRLKKLNKLNLIEFDFCIKY